MTHRSFEARVGTRVAPTSGAAVARFAVAVCLAAAVGLASPRSVVAQACLGVSTHDEDRFISARTSFTEGAWAPGGTLGYDAPGPVSVSGSFDYTLYDNSDVGVARVLGNVAVEVPNLVVSVCPVVGGGYQWLANEGELAGLDADGLLLAGGVAIGGRLESRSGLTVIPYGGAAVVHDRATFRFGSLSATESDTYGNIWLGFALAVGTVYLGPRVSFFTEEGSDAIFSVELGSTF